MILSFIIIRKVPQEVLKTSEFALGFQHLYRDLANVNEWKIIFDPYNKYCVPSYKNRFMGLKRKIIYSFYHIFAWQAAWSCDQGN